MSCTSLALSFGALGIAVGGALGMAFMACLVMSSEAEEREGKEPPR